MGRHSDPKADDFPATVSDRTWIRVTATEQWETTPAADSAGKARLN